MYNFSKTQLKRYARHFSLRDVGYKGQEKLLDAKVLLVGAGGLGSPAALYLAGAGIGHIGIIDADVVDISNLQRQIIHTSNDINRLKVESAKEKMLALNPDIKVQTYPVRLDSTNAIDIIKHYDFVIDGVDNFATKFLINDACVLLDKPFSHGGILRFNAQSLSVNPSKSACYACVFNAPPPKNSVPSCAEAGVLGPIAGLLGTIQAIEVLKFFTSAGQMLYNQLLSIDTKTMLFRNIKVQKNPTCRVCGSDGIKKSGKLSDYEEIQCEIK